MVSGKKMPIINYKKILMMLLKSNESKKVRNCDCFEKINIFAGLVTDGDLRREIKVLSKKIIYKNL